MPSLTRLYTRADLALAAVDAEQAALFPDPPPTRQPVHTLYLPADRVGADVVAEAGEAALAAFDEHQPDPGALRRVFRACLVSGGAQGQTEASDLHALVRAKLKREPIEDPRIDFEDGFTQRDVPAVLRDHDEDAHVDRLLAEVVPRPGDALLRGEYSPRSGMQCVPVLVRPARQHRPRPGPRAGEFGEDGQQVVRGRGIEFAQSGVVGRRPGGKGLGYERTVTAATGRIKADAQGVTQPTHDPTSVLIGRREREDHA